MLTVYKVENTRLIMPDSAWSCECLRRITAQGKHVEITNEDPDVVKEERSVDELERAMALIDSTGL